MSKQAKSHLIHLLGFPVQLIVCKGKIESLPAGLRNLDKADAKRRCLPASGASPVLFWLED